MQALTKCKEIHKSAAFFRDFSSSLGHLLNPALRFAVSYGLWNDHVLRWWEHKDDPNVLFLKFEDLKKVSLHVKVV